MGNSTLSQNPEMRSCIFNCVSIHSSYVSEMYMCSEILFHTVQSYIMSLFSSLFSPKQENK